MNFVLTGEAIEDAINSTQLAMERLKDELRFRVNPDYYHSARANTSAQLYLVREHVRQAFDARTRHFELTVLILKRLFPLALLLLVYVAYLHIKHYMSRDEYDNNYITEQFRQLDIKRSEVLSLC